LFLAASETMVTAQIYVFATRVCLLSL